VITVASKLFATQMPGAIEENAPGFISNRVAAFHQAANRQSGPVVTSDVSHPNATSIESDSPRHIAHTVLA